MRITVLGKSPAWQDAGGACSGYLVESERTCLLLDCGPGVLAKLRERIDYAGVDAVAITHLHADHILDLVPFASALTFSPRGAAGDLRRPALHAPSASCHDGLLPSTVMCNGPLSLRSLWDTLTACITLASSRP